MVHTTPRASKRRRSIRDAALVPDALKFEGETAVGVAVESVGLEASEAVTDTDSVIELVCVAATLLSTDKIEEQFATYGSVL